VNIADKFDTYFAALTGNDPFPWQEGLFREFENNKFPKDCVIPTGLGKTSIMAIWLLSLASHTQRTVLSEYPRRLIYVVNRRTVVDQSTQEAMQLLDALLASEKLKPVREALQSLAAYPTEQPLAISTLRGQFADNAEWRNDPSRPAIIAGTVDMIGSRLLFSGYGCGYKSRPLHAGFLGQNSLLIHDEAHLEPAFQELVVAVAKEQEKYGDPYPLRVMALTATSRSGQEQPFMLSEKDRNDETVSQRITAKKGIVFREIKDIKKIGAEIADFAERAYQGSDQAILIFLNTLDDVKKAEEILVKRKQQVQILTGTQRGWERDKLAESDPIFARFMPKPKATKLSEGTVYLLCTSAGEVGINISGDHLICDIVPADRMVQRFGRVNRFGNGDASIDIFITKTSQEETQTENEAETQEVESKLEAAPNTKKEPQSPFTQACINTFSLLQSLPQKDDKFDACPQALTLLSTSKLLSAFSPMPVVPSVDGILFDAWALTSIRKLLPGRPPVADWLHGIAGWEPPETHIAWRKEVGLLSSNLDLLKLYPPEDLLEDYPLKPHELLRDRSSRVFKELKRKNVERSRHSIWLISASGEVEVIGINDLIEKGEQAIEGKILLLPPEIGMLQNGMLNATADFDEGGTYDVADQWLNLKGNQYRCRLWDDEEPPSGMRLALTIDTRPTIDDDEDDEETVNRPRFWRWYVRPRSADDDGSRMALHPQCLNHHLGAAEKIAVNLAAKLNLRITETNALRFAAKNHDRGKARKVWQHSIGNHTFPNPTLAKSGGKMSPAELSRYRHEFGSLLNVQNDPEFLALTEEEQDLALHMIASHHGRARPHFSAEEAFDPENGENSADDLAAEIPRRFARLQRKYGRWGLAYLESLLRSVDALASQDRNTCDCNIDNLGFRNPGEQKNEQ
jgi:CRISPR-associated endonuclease/helicase Cas3